MLGGLALLLLMSAVWPRVTAAAEWNYSPYRAQFAADQPSNGQTGEESPTTPPVVSAKKSIGKGVMFSLVIPGAGQLYSGQWWRSIPWFAIEVGGWAMFAKYHGDGQDKTREFEAYAGPRDAPNHFNVNAYLLREYQIASSQQYNAAPYTGTLSDWRLLDWSVRQDFLANATGYGHDVMTDDQQQYYEMIGKYIVQFGYGWQDTYSSDADINDPNAGNIWVLSGDDPTTAIFDGTSAMFFHYRDMRGKANDLLNKGNVAMEVVLVNHILSALDAAFAVRAYNKHLEKVGLGDLKFRYDIKNLGGDQARFLTASLALD
jgi:hypothetical protein